MGKASENRRKMVMLTENKDQLEFYGPNGRCLERGSLTGLDLMVIWIGSERIFT
jgi:hypothetical protein